MTIYRLKWPDGLTAVVVVYHQGDTIETLTVTGAKVRLVDLAEIKSAAEFDAKMVAFASIQHIELIKRSS